VLCEQLQHGLLASSSTHGKFAMLTTLFRRAILVLGLAGTASAQEL
jgi:hypothetical protein